MLTGLETEVAVTNIHVSRDVMCLEIVGLFFLYFVYACCGDVHCFVRCQLIATKLICGAHSDRNYQ